MFLINEPRSAVARSRLFLQLASDCTADKRNEFEAFIEAAIIFGRAALHRFQARNEKHPDWNSWWSRLLDNPSVQFFRTERDWILKEAPPKIGQRLFAPTIGVSPQPSYAPLRATEFYFFNDPDVTAVDTVAGHLREMERVLGSARGVFS